MEKGQIDSERDEQSLGSNIPSMNTRQPVNLPVTLPDMTAITRQPVTAYICIGGVTGDGDGCGGKP